MPTLNLEWPTSENVGPFFTDLFSRSRAYDASIQICYVRRPTEQRQTYPFFDQWTSFTLARVEAPQELLDTLLSNLPGSGLRLTEAA